MERNLTPSELIMSVARNWCFTVNNYVQNDIEKIEEMFSHGHFNYVVYGIETGESGTPHLQGYVQLKKKLRLNQVKTLISSRAHLEVQRGSAMQAIIYCKKDGNFKEFGEAIFPGGMSACFCRLFQGEREY